MCRWSEHLCGQITSMFGSLTSVCSTLTYVRAITRCNSCYTSKSTYQSCVFICIFNMTFHPSCSQTLCPLSSRDCGSAVLISSSCSRGQSIPQMEGSSAFLCMHFFFFFFFWTDACVRDFEEVGQMDPRKCGTADIVDGNVFLWFCRIPQRSKGRMI